jgi:hypothetical protein
VPRSRCLGGRGRLSGSTIRWLRGALRVVGPHNVESFHKGAEQMSEYLIDSLVPQLAPPVSRELISGAPESDDGADLMWAREGPLFPFADDDAE